MIVGETMSGKTTCYKILKKAMNYLYDEGAPGINRVEHYELNPKSITID